MGYASRNNPHSIAKREGRLKPAKKEETTRQKLARARIERFDRLMRPKKENNA